MRGLKERVEKKEEQRQKQATIKPVIIIKPTESFIIKQAILAEIIIFIWQLLRLASNKRK